MDSDATPEPVETPQSQALAVPPTYVNFAQGRGSPMELTVTVGYRTEEAGAVVAAPMVMAWEFVPVLIKFLQDQLGEYEGQIGEVRNILRDQVGGKS